MSATAQETSPSVAPVTEAPVIKKAVAAGERLMSVDALRGFDMFWIVGAESIVGALKKISDSGLIGLISEQLEHKKWEGLHFYDMIFPLFVFIAGVSTVFSLSKAVEQGGSKAAMWRLFQRAVLLFVVGIFFYGGFSGKLENIRILGVLQRIALCYLFAGLAFCTLRLRGMIILCAGLLIGYWALMTFIPVPGVEGHSFDEGKNLANYIDRQYLPLKKWDGRDEAHPLGTHDPEGLLSTLPAIATCLLGCFAGMLLKDQSIDSKKKVMWLFAAGLIGIAVGYAWSLQFPIIKKIWTSSYVLVVGGYSSLFLAAFYLVVDVWKYQKWAMPFVWIGTNSITIYIGVRFIRFREIASLFVGSSGSDIQKKLGQYGELVVALSTLGVIFIFLNFLYRRKIFIRI